MPITTENGTGRRKAAIARVYLSSGKGKIKINGRDFKEYLCRESLANVVLEPLDAIDKVDAYDFNISVKGGGLTGQAGAIRLGIARALLKATSFVDVEQVRRTYPERILESAIKGMLPKNKLGRKMMTHLRIYAGSDHPHAAQNPSVLDK